MNERIIEFVRQAWSYADKHQTTQEQWFYEYNKKFADLIVQECAALAKSKSEHIEGKGIKTEDHDDQIQLHSLAWQFEEFGYEIKKHFGVEK
jgi:hypothetical protein